jgi:protein-tyrosine-phosphatase
MKAQTSVLLGIASALLGLSALLNQISQSVASQAAEQAGMPAAHARKDVIALFHEDGDITKRTMPKTLQAALANRRRRILFVCVENSNRSQMAEAFARLHGGDKVEAHSAGSRPSGRVNPRAMQFMREVGYDLARHESKSLDQFNGTEIDVAVTMGCGDACPHVPAARREEWKIPDPKDLSDEEFRKVRDLIERKVKELLAGL